MSSRTNYECPRCGYATHHRSSMRNHLYKKQKPCRATHEVIELTDVIKQHVLDNKVYKVPKQSQQQIIINQINNNQQIINYIAKIDPIQKLQAYTEYTDIALMPFEYKVKEYYQDKIEMCESMQTQLTDFCLDRNNLTNILNDMTLSNGIDKLNVVYDKVNDKLVIFDDGKWESHPFDSGVKELIEKIQCTYLDKYEELLLDKYDHDTNFLERKKAQERLKEYYEFLVVFEIKPLLVTSKRNDILDYNSKYYRTIYEKVQDKITFTHAKQLQKSVYSMVKTNCNSSIGELNKRMMDIICTDQDFKTKVLQMLQVSTT